MPVPRERFAHRQRSALEQLRVEAAYRFLGVGPLVELYEGEPAWLAGVAVHGQCKGGEGAEGSKVSPQLRFGHVIGKIANKKAYSHAILLLGR
jgi:hypothetical protein